MTIREKIKTCTVEIRRVIEKKFADTGFTELIYHGVFFFDCYYPVSGYFVCV